MQVFQPHTCSLKPWDAAAFSRCLEGRRLIFIGDSTARQQFQSLGCLLGNAVASEHISETWNASNMTGRPWVPPCSLSLSVMGVHEHLWLQSSAEKSPLKVLVTSALSTAQCGTHKKHCHRLSGNGTNYLNFLIHSTL